MLFVTGGTGLVGSHLLFQLASAGEEIVALKRPTSDLKHARKVFLWYSPDGDRLFDSINWVDGDLLNRDTLRPHLRSVNQIYHAAAMVSFDPADRDVMIDENEVGTANLIDLALEYSVDRFCHVSSIAALGTPPEKAFTNEDHPWNNNRPHSAYSISKFRAEMEVWRGITEGLEAVIVNPSVILGPGNWAKGSASMFPKVWKGVPFYSTGGTGFVDVRDVARAMISLMNHPQWANIRGERYILNGANLRYKDLLFPLAEALNVAKPRFKATRLILEVGWRLMKLISLFTGKRPALTRETARSASNVSFYDNSKLINRIDFQYTAISDTIFDFSAIYLSDTKSNNR